MKEDEGDIAQACEILQQLQVIHNNNKFFFFFFFFFLNKINK